MKLQPKCSILGTVGVPACYGGFETLAEKLVLYHSENDLNINLSVYCSAKSYPGRPEHFQTAKLRYIDLDANGPQSILYDMTSLVSAVYHRANYIILLGVSGALALPFVRLFSHAHVITNIDGIEWKREKWRGPARLVLKWSERAAVRWSHVVIADNAAIADHVKNTYGIDCKVIAYGGDHAVKAAPVEDPRIVLPEEFALALCRIEPENNVAMILEAFAGLDTPLVFVGNWDKSDYGRDLKARYKDHPTITIHNPVYDPRDLRAIRDRASMYVHGHSAGGTNPSLVEMMHFDIPVLAHGCSFNHHTTEGKARYFTSADELAEGVRSLSPQTAAQIGADMGEIARRRYTWNQIGRAYFALLES